MNFKHKLLTYWPIKLITEKLIKYKIVRWMIIWKKNVNREIYNIIEEVWLKDIVEGAKESTQIKSVIFWKKGKYKTPEIDEHNMNVNISRGYLLF